MLGWESLHQRSQSRAHVGMFKEPAHGTSLQTLPNALLIYLLLYLNTHLCLIHLKGCSKNSNTQQCTLQRTCKKPSPEGNFNEQVEQRDLQFQLQSICNYHSNVTDELKKKQP